MEMDFIKFIIKYDKTTRNASEAWNKRRSPSTAPSSRTKFDTSAIHARKNRTGKARIPLFLSNVKAQKAIPAYRVIENTTLRSENEW
jgi:hypothetical protein